RIRRPARSAETLDWVVDRFVGGEPRTLAPRIVVSRCASRKRKTEVAGIEIGIVLFGSQSGRGRPLDCRRDAGATFFSAFFPLLHISPRPHRAPVLNHLAAVLPTPPRPPRQQLPINPFANRAPHRQPRFKREPLHHFN